MNLQKLTTTRLKLRRGMTLVETVVVVMIISILVVYISTALLSFIRPSPSDTVDKFKETLKYCYRLAMIHNQAVILKVNLDENKYSAYRVIRSEEGIEEKKFLEIGLPSNARIKKIIDLRGVNYDTGIVNIPFTYTGVAEDFSFHFGNDSQVVRSVILYKYNGKVIVKPGEVSRVAKENPAGSSIDLEEDSNN